MKITYRWRVLEDGETGKWFLTQEQKEFLLYLQKNDFLRLDVEFEEEVDYE
jgi:hypothetical protein